MSAVAVDRPWLSHAPRVDFARVYEEAEDDPRPAVLPFGSYAMRLEYVEPRLRRFLYVRWRVLDGRHRGSVVEAMWRDTDLARYLPGLGLAERDYAHVEALDGFVPLLEGHVADVMLLDEPDRNVIARVSVLGRRDVLPPRHA